MRKTILSLAAAVALVAAPSAFAADRSGTVGPSSPSYEWDGGPGSSVGYNAPVIGGLSVGNFAGCFDGFADCEETLIKVEAAGKLLLTAKSSAPQNDEIDLYLWPSNEAGEFEDSGSDLGDGAGASATGDEKLELDVTPGYYIAQIKFFLADNATYHGAAVLSGFAVPAAPAVPTAPPPPTTGPPPPAPAQPSQPASRPAAKKKKASKKKKACVKKAKKIKNKKKRKKALRRCSKKR